MRLSEVQERIRKVAHWINVETEVPILHKYVSALHKGQTYFEIGTGLGCSSIIAALSSVERVQVWTVDIGSHYLDKLDSLEAYENTVLAWYKEYGVQHRITFLCTDSRRMLWSKPIHVLFIDGDHSYESVVADIEQWTPHVNGVVLFHDYYCPHTPGVKQAVDECMADWQEVENGGSIKVFRRVLHNSNGSTSLARHCAASSGVHQGDSEYQDYHCR